MSSSINAISKIIGPTIFIFYLTVIRFSIGYIHAYTVYRPTFKISKIGGIEQALNFSYVQHNQGQLGVGGKAP